MCAVKAGLRERQNARRGGRSPNGMARQYRLAFRNVLRVHQGEEYARWVARREGETCRDVRRRIIKAGYDGIRVEYHDGGAVEYVAFSNRSITPINQDMTMPLPSKVNPKKISVKVQESFAHRRESKRLLDLAKHTVEMSIE